MLRRTTNQATPTIHRQTAYWSVQQRRKNQNLERNREKGTAVGTTLTA